MIRSFVLARLVLSVVLITVPTLAGIYPDDHWNYSTKLTKSDYTEKIQSSIDDGKTAPAWNAVTKTFAGSPDVAFMDVNLSEESIREGPNGEPYSPGAGGWPTVRYFNQKTGIAGGTYVKKTSDPMCTELGNVDNMEEYVEEYGNTSLCTVETEKGCDEKEIGYIAKMKDKSGAEVKSQLDRLASMEDGSMTADLLKWVKKRTKILKQLVSEDADEAKSEL